MDGTSGPIFQRITAIDQRGAQARRLDQGDKKSQQRPR